jgi:hypothetical protein
MGARRYMPASNEPVALTECMRARTSPVVGHILSNISPVPFHSPSYTPGCSFELKMSSADSIVEALLDKCLRAKRAQRMVKIEFLDKVSIVDECQARLQRFDA